MTTQHATTNLEAAKDLAPEYGMSEMGEARFVRDARMGGGPDGLELLACGGHAEGDSEMQPGWWTD